jgi:hypothetical protein
VVQIKRLLAALGIAALVACRVVPFDPGLSLAALSTRHMEHVGTIGPINDVEGGGASQYRFVPERDVLQGQPLRGWIVATGEGYLWATYAYGPRAFSPSSWSGPWSGRAALKPLTDLTTCKLAMIGPSFNGGYIALQPRDSGGVEDPTSGYNHSLGQYASAVTALSTTYLVGASFGPDGGPPDTTTAMVRVLTTDRNVATAYHEAWATLDLSLLTAAGETLATESVTGLPDPAVTGPGQYYYGSTHSYFSTKGADGRWTTYRWNHTDFAATPVVQARVDALLSTGQLFSRSGSHATVYSGAGHRLAEFPLGDLDYVGEYWSAARARFDMLFAQPLFISQGDSDWGELRFEIYTLPTARITSLE